jgi:hypothetical protein
VKKKKNIKKKKIGVSKLVIFSFILLYYVSFAIATKIVLVESAQLYAYLAYIGAPVTVIIPFYLSKSKAENISGGIVYETAMAGICEESNSESNSKSKG